MAHVQSPIAAVAAPSLTVNQQPAPKAPRQPRQPKASGWDGADSILTHSALDTLRALCGDKIARHEAILREVGTIAALALAQQPPKGYGNPADHAKVSATLKDGKGTARYADAAVGFSAALKQAGFRSVASWDDALTQGLAIASAMFAELAPKVYSKTEQAERDAKRATRKAEREAAAKAEASEAADKAAELKRAELAAEFERGRQAGRMEAVNAEAVAQLIRLGGFTSAELAQIADALKAAPIDVTARDVTHPGIPA